MRTGSKFGERPRPPDGLEAVVFDLGGTLIDYLGGAPSWPAMENPGVEAAYACLSSAGLALDSASFHESFIAAMDERWRAATAGLHAPPTLGDLVIHVCGTVGFGLPDHLLAASVACYVAPIAARSRVAEGARDVIVWLHQHGIRLGIISNTIWPAEAHLDDLSRYGLLDHFDHVLFSSETGLWKPDRRVFDASLAHLGVAPERAVFIGDRLVEDVQGAQRAGLRAIFLEGTQDYEDIDLSAFTPDARIRSLRELPSALAELWES
ncbi:MAG: HAD-superfamily hydrolase, subfamily variant 3 [Chloroflexi bacterium]|nr:HAD-superfamily hydrolase, subfamily variant 3 [Chloroflexota bacterium]